MRERERERRREVQTTAAGWVSVAARRVTFFPAPFPALLVAGEGYSLVDLGDLFQTHTFHFRLKHNLISRGDCYFHL